MAEPQPLAVNLDRFYAESCTILQEAELIVEAMPNVDRPAAARAIRQVTSIRALVPRIDDPFLSNEERNNLLDSLNVLVERLERFLEEQEHPKRLNLPVVRTGGRGRPAIALNLNRALALHDMGNTWEDVANAMGVGRQTLYDHLKRAGHSSARREHTDITDDDLDRRVTEISSQHPFSGYMIIQGHLESQGIHLPRKRVQESLLRVDEIGALIRWVGVIKRRVYRVRGANALWHNDGNEKLRPWGFWVHGMIDGSSRLIIYLECCPNKKSKTVRGLFLKATRIFGWPSRCRGDFGKENNGIEVEMIAHWGEAHRAYLRGRSFQNIRIERLWRDVRKDALELFRIIFKDLVESELLDMREPVHRICLFLVFQPRIQAALDRAREAWNHHKVSTERSKTPVARFELSREHAITHGYWTGDPGDPVEDVADEEYGVDRDAPLPPAAECLEDPEEPDYEEEEPEKVQANTAAELRLGRELLQGLDLTEEDGNWGIDVYCRAVIMMTERLNENSDANDSDSDM